MYILQKQFENIVVQISLDYSNVVIIRNILGLKENSRKIRETSLYLYATCRMSAALK